MSDLRVIRDMFSRAGVVFEETVGASGYEGLPGRVTTLAVKAGEGRCNYGWPGFAAEMYFDVTGNLRAVGVDDQ